MVDSGRRYFFAKASNLNRLLILKYVAWNLSDLNENGFNMASELEKGAQLKRLWLSFQPFMQMMGHYTSCFALLDDQNSCIPQLIYGHVRMWPSYYAYIII